MLRKALLLKIFEAASMQRWNDQIRPVELTELDKQAHKMIIAYVLGKCEEEFDDKNFNWIEIIEGGFFEFLQRIVLTDLKPPLFHKIKEDRDKYQQLNEWVYEEIYPVIATIGKEFCLRFHNYLFNTERNINRKIISASHFYATKWEFDIIERTNPNSYLIDEIKNDLSFKQEQYKSLKCMQSLLNSGELRQFINICGQLRFQVRWSHLQMLPRTSVLGHMLIVALLTYLFSLKISAEPKRCINNYFTALFHDLPEVLTRDIINPVKRSIKGLRELIQEYEREEMERKIYKLIPQKWYAAMKMFTEDEFTDIKASNDSIERDGALIKGIDDLSAFIEIYLSLKNGLRNEYLESAKYSLLERYRTKIISNIDFGQIYADFD